MALVLERIATLIIIFLLYTLAIEQRKSNKQIKELLEDIKENGLIKKRNEDDNG